MFGLSCSSIKYDDEVVWTLQCRMNIFTLICFLVPVAYAQAVTVNTPLGTASGTQDPVGTYRFPVKYASADRWAPSTVASTWALPYVFFCAFMHKTQ